MLKRSVALMSIVSALFVASNALADDDDRVFPPDSQPFGHGYGQWSVRWWEWVFSIPTAVNPAASDNTGALCGVGQQGPVWNLAGTFSPGPVTRTCSIPAGRGIFFPVVNGECSTAENPALTTEAQLRNCAVSQLQPVDVLQAELDGVPIQDLDDFVFQSPLFTYWAPADNVVPVPGGPLTSHSVADGFFVMLKPLSVGSHTLHFKGGISSVGFIIEATYHLHIVP